MELEFDKEIDALLRKARSPSATAPAAPAGGHLDADEFAAFAENALPDRSRQMYIAHLADCDTCRKTLSGFISTVPAAAPEAAFDAAAPAVVKDIPWFRRLFAIPSLVYTLGGLLVVFTAFVGLLVYQSGRNGNGSEVSKVTEKAPVAARPAIESEDQESSNATAANSAANSSSPIDDVTKSGIEVGSTDTVVQEEKQQQPAAGQDETAAAGKAGEPSADTTAAPLQKPATEQPAAAPPPKDAPIVTTTDRDAKLDAERARDKSPELSRGEKSKEANVVSGAVADDAVNRNDALKKSEDKDMRSMREAPAPSSKTASSRTEGPRQNQNQVATQNNEMQAQNNLPLNGRRVEGVAGMAASATRSVSGKTFTLRSGIWYDSAYGGGGTKDVHRGTDKYQKLDEGLRSIGDSISGTVVVVWKGTSYKIR